MRNTPVEHKQTGWVGGNAKHQQTIDRRRLKTELPQGTRFLTSVYCMLCLSTFRNVSSRACLWHAAFIFARGGYVPPRLSSLSCSCKSKLGSAPAVVPTSRAQVNTKVAQQSLEVITQQASSGHAYREVYVRATVSGATRVCGVCRGAPRRGPPFLTLNVEKTKLLAVPVLASSGHVPGGIREGNC